MKDFQYFQRFLKIVNDGVFFENVCDVSRCKFNTWSSRIYLQKQKINPQNGVNVNRFRDDILNIVQVIVYCTHKDYNESIVTAYCPKNQC
jgi:hypothetical protein